MKSSGLRYAKRLHPLSVMTRDACSTHWYVDASDHRAVQDLTK
jgi:hypothetical protein